MHRACVKLIDVHVNSNILCGDLCKLGRQSDNLQK
jgi:hypothetical protein